MIDEHTPVMGPGKGMAADWVLIDDGERFAVTNDQLREIGLQVETIAHRDEGHGITYRLGPIEPPTHHTGGVVQRRALP